MDVSAVLAAVRSGELDTKEAEKMLKKLPYEDLGYAKIDHHRRVRQGFEEVIYCQGKETEHLVGICRRMAEEGINVLGTRASKEQAEAVMREVPVFTYEPVARLLKAEFTIPDRIGRIAVCTGGTADIPVAEEAAGVAEFFGTNVSRLFDVGVAGIHRLLRNLSIFEGRHGRGAAGSGGRTGGRAGHCSSYKCRIWGKLSGAVRAPDHDQFLRQRDHGRQH